MPTAVPFSADGQAAHTTVQNMWACYQIGVAALATVFRDPDSEAPFRLGEFLRQEDKTGVASGAWTKSQYV